MLPGFNEKQMNILIKSLMILSLLGGFVLAFYTLHDLQTAEGAGLYLSITFHQSSRTLFDAIVDLGGMLLLVLVTILPPILMKHKSLASYFRLFSLYLAFMPIVHPGNVVHLVNAFRSISLRPNLLNGHVFDYVFQDLLPVFDMLKWLLPFFLLIYALNKLSKSDKSSISKWLAFLLLVCLLGFCIFESVAFVFLYLAYYFVIIWCFHEAESFFKTFPRFAVWGNILFFGCLLRGIYRMLELISTTHI